MSQRQKSFLSRLSLYNWNISLKLNVLVYALLVFSFTVIAVVGYSLLKKYSENLTYQKLEQITYHKKLVLEKDYKFFINDSKALFSVDILSDVEKLITAFKDFPSELTQSFYPDSLSLTKELLKDYYETEIISNIEWNKPELKDIFPERDIELVFQNIYIANNKWPIGEKDKLVNSMTGTNYSRHHQSIHTKFKSFVRQHKVNNIYIIDNTTGDIIYNYNKNIAFATNLFNGNYKTSELSRIFQQALSSTSQDIGQLFYSDFTNFSAELNQPVAYIAQNLLLYNNKIAVAVIELSPDFFESIVVDNWLEQNWKNIDVNILGEDRLIRMNETEQLAQPDEYINKLKKGGIKSENILKASQLEGGACVLGYNKGTIMTNSNLEMTKNDFNESVFFVDMPLDLKGFDYSIIGLTKFDKHEELLARTQRNIILVYIILLILASFSLRGVIRSMIFRLSRLSNAFICLSKGQETQDFVTPWKDELGNSMHVFNTLNNRLRSVQDLAIQLSAGDLNHEFVTSSENDALANALNTLGKSLKKEKEKSELRIKEDEKTKWLNEGVALFNDLLRKSNNDIKELAFIVVENLVSYLNAIQGGVFLVEGDSNSSVSIHLTAAFAYDRRKYNEKVIEIGEGLLGNCYLERKSVHLKKLPEDYLEVTSGLGSGQPQSLYIVPLMVDENILGFIELASLNDFEEQHIEFIEKLSENIAATFATVKLNTRTAELLEESKRRANEIAQQEEEMRQNMEEMQATQEELARLREEDERRTQALQNQISVTSNMLQTLIDTMPGEVIVKDIHGVIVLANQRACNRYNTTIDAVKGMIDGELLDKTILEAEHALDAEVIKEGEYIGYRTENVGGSLVEYELEKRTFYLKGKNETGIITIWKKAEKGNI